MPCNEKLPYGIITELYTILTLIIDILMCTRDHFLDLALTLLLGYLLDIRQDMDDYWQHNNPVEVKKDKRPPQLNTQNLSSINSTCGETGKEEDGGTASVTDNESEYDDSDMEEECDVPTKPGFYFMSFEHNLTSDHHIGAEFYYDQDEFIITKLSESLEVQTSNDTSPSSSIMIEDSMTKSFTFGRACSTDYLLGMSDQHNYHLSSYMKEPLILTHEPEIAKHATLILSCKHVHDFSCFTSA